MIGRCLIALILSVLVMGMATVPAGCQDVSMKVSVHVIQGAASVNSTRSITFLSSGYQNESIFLQDVNTCVSTLYNTSTGIVSDPWPRYASLLNFYALYERSIDVGASRRKERLHDCDYMTICEPRIVQNNLGCSFGTPNPRLISCNINAVVELASLSPEMDVVVVLVNDAEPSGAATSGVAYITNDPIFMPFLLVHYLNHAFAGLHEEYSFDFKEAQGQERYGGPNCALSGSSKAADWNYWNGRPFVNETVATGARGAGCSFSNFEAPTQSDCLMRNSSVSVMCPVCRESLNLALLDDGVTGSLVSTSSVAALSLISGQCPSPDKMIYVDPTASDAQLILSVGSFARQSDVEVTWYGSDGTVLAVSAPQLVVTDFTTWSFPTVIRATVVDNSPYVRPSWRTPNRFSANASFYVNERTDFTICDAKPPTCFADLGMGTNYVPCVTQLSDVPELARSSAGPLLEWRDVVLKDNAEWPVDDAPESPQYNHAIVVAVSCVVVGVGVCAFVIIMLVYYTCVKSAPREVLDTHAFDRVVYCALCCSSVAVIVMSSLALIFSVVFIPVEFVFGVQIFICVVVIGGVSYVFGVVNLCSALFRWFVMCVLCAVLLVLTGLGFFAVGTFAIWAKLNRDSVAFSRSLSRLWVGTISRGKGKHICNIQHQLRCSGFHAGCFMTDSSECPPGCASNIFVNACQVRYLEFVSRRYIPIGVISIICGFLFVVAATFNILYYMRFRQISRTGRLRRSFRSDPHSPVVPITYREAKEVRRMFKSVCRQPTTSLDGKAAVSFLEDIFGEPLSKDYALLVIGRGLLTYDELMTMHFPYITSSVIDPRMLYPDESEGAGDVVQLQKRQYAKLEAFMEAAGTLSPEVLHNLFQAYTRRRFLPKKDDILSAISEEASRCTDAPYCRGLTSRELEGLRGAWVALNPRITGYLTDEQIERFYRWSHGHPISSVEAFDWWRVSLDITNSGKGVGWREFCYPYAQRALLQQAREFLAEQGKDLPPEIVSREALEAKYGKEVAERCLLPCEREVPIERPIAFLLKERLEADSAAMVSQRGNEAKERLWVEGAILSLIQTVSDGGRGGR